MNIFKKLDVRLLLSSVATLSIAGMLLAPHDVAHAEDIDIYGAASAVGNPTVMFLFDNTGAWSSNTPQPWNSQVAASRCPATPVADQTACRALIEALFYEGVAATVKRPWESGYTTSANRRITSGQLELRALRYTLKNVVCTGTAAAVPMSIGISLMGRGTARNSSDSSGVITFAARPMAGVVTDATSTCGLLDAHLRAIDAGIVATPSVYTAAAGSSYGAAFFELYKYFGGHSNPNLTGTSDSTAGTPVGAQGYGATRFSTASALDDPLAFTDVARTTYRSPITPADNCAKNFIVIVGNTYSGAEPVGAARLGGLNYTTRILPDEPTRFGDEWSLFLSRSDVSPVVGIQNVYTYALNVHEGYATASSDVARMMKAIGVNGGAGLGYSAYNEVTGDQPLTTLIRALSDVLVNAAAANGAFAATSLPVSTTTQGTYLNQLFVGMFRPDGANSPRWTGNLKQYKLGLDSATGELSMVDANGAQAVLRGTGFFAPTAKSFWTTDSVFFNGMPSGTPISNSDSPDGYVVEKGGAAQKWRSDFGLNMAARKIYTAPSTVTAPFALSTQPFLSTNSNVSSRLTAFQVDGIRGGNNQTPPNQGSEVGGSYLSGSVITNYNYDKNGPRPTIHGDVIHSRPAAINYGGGRVVVYYGTNDGLLHAVDGSATAATGGSELWSFIAPEHYSMLVRQFDNTPEVFLPSSPTSDGGSVTQPANTVLKDYAFDGPIGSLVTYDTAGNVVTAKIFVAMRRGGRAVYAFDVSDPTAPRLMWKVDPTKTGFDQTAAQGLGQTWSTPKAVIFPPSVSSVPLIIMGGGYDNTVGENQGSSPFLGGSVFVINANTGALVRRLTGFFSMPSDVTLVDTNFDGVIDRGYVTDVKGIVYRITMHDAAGVTQPPASWSIKKIANLQNRTYFAPDVVVANDFIAVLQGTGNREQPRVDYTDDGFYLIKDKKIGQVDRTTEIFRADLTRIARVDSATDDIVDIVDGSADPEGCWIQLSRAGEKVVNAPFTIAGATYFGTNRPDSTVGSCTGALGKARAYTFPLFCGTPTSNKIDGGGLPPSPVGGLVNIDVNGVNTLVPFLIGSGAGGSAFEATRPRPPFAPVRKKNFWRIDNGNR